MRTRFHLSRPFRKTASGAGKQNLGEKSARQKRPHSSTSGLSRFFSPLEEEIKKLVRLFGGNFPKLKEVERLLVTEALRLADNNQGIAASLLGISRNAFNKRLVREKKVTGQF
ncbi:MAG: hypothetical protein GY950_23670 [bacterium]|nr:hypothetical protein [bacterium]